MDEPILRRALIRRGTSERDVRRAIRSRRWRTLRPGAYLLHDDPRWQELGARHVVLTDATFARLGPAAVVSHLSAALRYGLPVWDVPVEPVHVTRDRASGGRGGPRLRVHAAPLPDGDVVVVRGLPTTSVARTVVDVARTASFELGVAVADAALHRHLTTAGQLSAALESASGRRGIGRARAVLGFADPRADGPGESRSRVRMDALGVVAPVLQHRIRDPGGRELAQVDFWWPEHRVIGEFDGLAKYDRLLRPGESPAEAVVREKRREDALRALPEVREFVRWTWADIDGFAAIAARLPRTSGWNARTRGERA